MSKVNRRKEIKEKEAFQLRFQLALNESNNTVANWLPKQNEETEKPSGDDFLNLPILTNGSGLYELEEDDEAQKTISDFVNPEKDPQKVKVQENRQNQAGTKAMTALINKMRNDSRGRANNKDGQGPKKKETQKQKQKPVKVEVESDSDEEERKISAQRSTKKATKVSKRPF
ncbi:uncharacterized protein CXQ87_001414 [Candidozyma duobushaemuli]|uniref:Nucleolar protein 19 n=1 Tax=Candidozyma duobushaemuli TaxID=1231522 RepID=A0A2V1ALC5_9ASCO|nr:uncharacterized protein CXQ87_001414 [[Candida] duobushaemulonis]PVH18484.1 hypothetical protein CXQ87_001414 [[Candida] duobushaemulonis]